MSKVQQKYTLFLVVFFMQEKMLVWEGGYEETKIRKTLA
jgi:hypothetical protein